MTLYRINPRLGGCELSIMACDATGKAHWVPLGADGRPAENSWHTTGVVGRGPRLSNDDANDIFQRIEAKSLGACTLIDRRPVVEKAVGVSVLALSSFVGFCLLISGLVSGSAS